jgi:hypothetical protein
MRKIVYLVLFGDLEITRSTCDKEKGAEKSVIISRGIMRKVLHLQYRYKFYLGFQRQRDLRYMW